ADDPAIAKRLADETAMYVVFVSRDVEQITAARRSWIADGKYGPRLTARLLDDSIPTHSVNLVVAPEDSDVAKWKPLLQPGGKLMQGDEVIAVGESFDGASTWTHMYGRPDNSAYAGENLSDAESYDDLTLLWLGRPGPRYQSDRGNRKPAPLAAGGRLYMQGLNRLIAVNAYSGIVIWSLELPELQRFNIPRDTCNWCAEDEYLWISMGDRIWKLDGATGKMLEWRSVDRPEGATDEVTWGFLARVEDQLFGSAVAEGGHYKDWWGGASWYDAKDGNLTHKVCSMNLVAYEADSGKVQWQHERGGAIMNPTVTIVDDLVVFAENPNLYAKKKSRFDDSIFSQLRLVALDRKTGKVRWEKPVEQRDGTVACYVAATSEGIIYQTSKGGEFDVSLRDPKTGDVKWSKIYKWEVDHHGKHLSRPAIVNGRIVIRPHVIDIKTGETLDHKFPKGHQCGTYVCSDKALFLRAGDLTMWNLENNDSSKLKRVRPDCWISTIPALGMLLSPEGGGGCSCGSWLETSMGFIPNVHAAR
ncbi:MAG: PQQ-binding-like beta-propeller repeat protein, partial [Planctomycetota bacterium]